MNHDLCCPTEMSEQAVRASLEAGDLKRAVASTLKIYGCELYGFILNCLEIPADADDVFGVVCEGVCKGIHRFNWQSSLRTWLYTMTKNAVYRHANNTRRHRKRLRSIADTPEVYQIVQAVQSRTRPYQSTRVKDQARTIRKRLPLPDQLLLILRIDRNLSWRDIAEIITEKPLDDSDLKRGAQRMRKRFQRVKRRFRELAQSEGLI